MNFPHGSKYAIDAGCRCEACRENLWKSWADLSRGIASLDVRMPGKWVGTKFPPPDPRDRVLWQELDLPWYQDWCVRHPDTGEIQRFDWSLERWAFETACEFAKEWTS